jgi:hypothetical protein
MFPKRATPLTKSEADERRAQQATGRLSSRKKSVVKFNAVDLTGDPGGCPVKPAAAMTALMPEVTSTI